MFVAGVTGNIINNNMHDKTTFIKVSIIAAIMLTTLYLCAVALIIRNKRNPLIFTETGIVGTGFFNAKYERIGTFRWEICNGLLATGEATKQSKKTLLITANTGLFPEMAYKTRIGTSILGSYGYYFDETQVNKVEVILSGVGIKKLPDKT